MVIVFDLTPSDVDESSCTDEDWTSSDYDKCDECDGNNQLCIMWIDYLLLGGWNG